MRRARSIQALAEIEISHLPHLVLFFREPEGARPYLNFFSKLSPSPCEAGLSKLYNLFDFLSTRIGNQKFPVRMRHLCENNFCSGGKFLLTRPVHIKIQIDKMQY